MFELLHLHFRESGWQSGRELDFYPSNPGSTPARVPTTKKIPKKIKDYIKNIKTTQCAFHELESQGVLKKNNNKTKEIFHELKILVVYLYSYNTQPQQGGLKDIPRQAWSGILGFRWKD